MSSKNTIVINGKVYDAITGLPVAAPDPIPGKDTPSITVSQETETLSPATVRRLAHASTAHRKVQRSTTLRRDILKAPTKPHHAHAKRAPSARNVARSDMITRFAAHPQPIKKPSEQVAHKADAPLLVHRPPALNHTPATRVHTSAHEAKKPAALSSRELKEKLIAERLASIKDTPVRDHKAPTRHPFFARAPRASSIIVASFAIVFLGGYLTYISMPNLSMRVAASHAGVDATFPDYKPDGYRFDGPIAYNTGEVNVRFASNSNQTSYTIHQNSGWDSQAVLDNYVSKKAKDYLTYSEQGVTIYTYDGKAAWVNGGVFYTIEGDAPLSSDQILRIASSM